MPASSPGASVAHLPAMAVYGPLTRPLPTVLQPVDSLSGKHLSASPVSTDSSVHNSLESWFHVSSSSSNSSFSVHPSVPPLPKGARAPSPQPSSSRIAQHTHAATLPSLVSPAPSPSGSRQACHSLSWSFEWRGISKIVKWASTSQSEKSPDNVQPSRPPSPRFPESTAVIGIYKDAEARHYAPKNFPGAHVHEDLDASEPPASFANSSSRVDLAEGRYNCSQSEHGHSARSHHLNADVGLNFPSISEVHLPRGSKGGRRPQQPYLQITPRRSQHVRYDSSSRHDLDHIIKRNDSTTQLNARMAFSDCGHSNDQFGRESWISQGAFSEQGHGDTKVPFPSYTQTRQIPPPLPFTSAQGWAASRKPYGDGVQASVHNTGGWQRTQTTSSRASTLTTTSKRKLRKHSRTRSAAASRTSLVTEESIPRSKTLPPTPSLPSEAHSPDSEFKPKPRKLMKRRTNGHEFSPPLPVRDVNEPMDSKNTASTHLPLTDSMDHHDVLTDLAGGSPIMRPSFLRTESQRRWTVAVADVPDDLLIEELERLRRLGMRAGEVHGNPSETNAYSLEDMHASMSDECVPVVDSAYASDFNHDAPGHGDDQEWAFARRAMLCCRDLVKTERTYQERLQDLARKQVSDKLPALALQYLPALIVASNILNERFADDPSAYGVSLSFLETQIILETAFVAWCGVVGEFFSDEPRREDAAANHSRMSHTCARKPSVLLRRYPGRYPSNMPQPRSLSVHDHAFMAWSSSNGNDGRGHLSAASDTIALQLSSIREAERAAEKKEPLTGFARSFNVSSSRDKKSSARRRRPPFRELAILPTQRVTRYVLLFKDLLKHTPMTSPTRDVVQRALECANSLAAKCDRAQGNANFLYNS